MAKKKMEYPPAANRMGLMERKHDFYEVVIVTVQKYCWISIGDSGGQSIPVNWSQSQSDEEASGTTL